MKIKKGDLVQVISGRSQKNGGDRGKQGKVIAVYPETQRVLVEGINRVTKHAKAGATARGTRTGGLIAHRGRDPREQRGDRRPRVEEADPVKTRVETVERNGRQKAGPRPRRGPLRSRTCDE